jgi:hypothetical protein
MPIACKSGEGASTDAPRLASGHKEWLATHMFIGAGEGNRTLVISLEGSWRSNNINGFSDIFARFAPLVRNGKAAMSECGCGSEFKDGRYRSTPPLP